MAKPMEMELGSAMHIHQSILDAEGNNLFSLTGGEASPALFHCIAGLQTYLPEVIPMLAPYVNSYRRLSPHMSAPTNMRCSYDNHTCGIRVPQSDPVARRVENRVPGVDVNPYLAIAATLACGYLGLCEQRQPSAPLAGNAWDKADELPRYLEDAIALLRACSPVRDLLGSNFVDAFCAVNELEFGAYNRVISSWEREHLLLLGLRDHHATPPFLLNSATASTGAAPRPCANAKWRPSPRATRARAHCPSARLGLSHWQFALAATNANRYVLRWLRAVSGRTTPGAALDMRLLLEGEAAERGALRLVAPDAATLAVLSAQMDAALKAADARAYLAANEEFHLILYRAAGSPTLLALIETV